jgi:hypothetical protein
MDQVMQVLGAVLILVAFTAGQAGILDQRSYIYLLLNVVGSAILAVIAAQGKNWGFLLLEGVWAIVSLWSLVLKTRRDRVGQR